MQEIVDKKDVAIEIVKSAGAITEENSAATEEVAAASKELTASSVQNLSVVAEGLMDVIIRFKV